MIRPLLAAMLALAFSTHAASQREDTNPAPEPLAWAAHVTPGPAVTIKLKHAVGKSLIYEGTLNRTQTSANSYEAEEHFYLNAFCADQQDNRDLLALWRTYTDRKRVEKLANGRKIDRVLENTNELIDLGPNFVLVGTLRCYPFDAQNRVAYHTTQLLKTDDGREVLGTVFSQDDQHVVFIADDGKLDLPREHVVSVANVPLPHVFINEAPHYLFPLFSARAVAPGDTWRFRVPIIIPIEQGGTSAVLPTQFDAVLTGRLREAGNSIAVVDYHVQGEFDSDRDEFKARLPALFAENHIRHRLDGTGTVTVDLDKGRLTSKTEAFTIELFASSVVRKEGKPPKRDESKAEISSRFELKLLPPGTQLKSGALVPQNE